MRHERRLGRRAPRAERLPAGAPAEAPSGAGAAGMAAGAGGAGPAGAPPAGWWSHPALLVALAAAALYLPSLGYGFVWDDHRLIEVNPLLRTLDGLRRLLFSDFWVTGNQGGSGLWRPLIVLSYWLDGVVSRWTPGWYRAVNVAAHAAVSALVVLLLLRDRVPRWAAMLAGLWFAVMPVHVESVAWISGRTDLFCAAFFLLALLLDRRARHAGRAWPGVGAVAALALALLSKEAALPFLAVVALAEWLEARDGRFDWRASLRWLLPYAALTALYLVAHAAAAGRPPLPAYLDAELRARSNWATLRMFPGYLAFLWPWYPHSPAVTLALPESPWSVVFLAAAALQLVFLALLGILTARRARAALPLGLFWLVLLPPTVAMAAVSALLYSERFVYLPSAGAAWALGLGLAAVARRPALARVAGTLAAALVLASAAQSLRVLPVWSSDAALFRAMARDHPRNFLGRVNWARVLIAQGREAEAQREIEAAAALYPREPPEVPSLRALLHHRHGEWAEMLADAERALALDSTLAEARLSRATALVRLRRTEAAGAALASLRGAMPNTPAIESLWGQYLLMRNRTAQALPFLEGAGTWIHDDADLEFARGTANARLRRMELARAAFARAVGLDSTFYDAWLSLGAACHFLGDAAARDSALRRAAALPAARDGRAVALARRLGGGAP